MSAESVSILAGGGASLAVSVCQPSATPRALLVVAPATGVVRQFYHRFLSAMADRGYLGLSLDYRGIGGSRPAALRGYRASMRDWATLDLGGLLDWSRTAFPDLPLVIAGHSFGGQAIGLVAERRPPAAVVLIGAQSGYYGHWPTPRRQVFRALHAGLIPVLTAAFGYFPSGLIGMGESLPAGVAREWARWCQTPSYLSTFDGHRSLGVPLLSITASDDSYAPRKAVDALLAEYAAASLTKWWVEPKALGAASIGHFGYFRPGIARPLWAEIGDWLDAAIGAPNSK